MMGLNKKTAELTAKHFSKANNFAYVPENKNVVTCVKWAPNKSGFVAMEILMHSGAAVAIGEITNQTQAEENAQKYANEKGSWFILVNS